MAESDENYSHEKIEELEKINNHRTVADLEGNTSYLEDSNQLKTFNNVSVAINRKQSTIINKMDNRSEDIKESKAKLVKM